MSLYRIKNCETCGREFLAHIAQKWCPDCKKKQEVKPLRTIICPFCEKTFTTVKTNKRYCTDKCKRAFHSREYYRGKNDS